VALASKPKRKRERTKSEIGSSKSLQKAIRILLHMGRHGSEMGVTQIATALNLNKTTVHRLLNAMGKFELIEKNPRSERYRLGLKLHELGSRAVESRDLRAEAHRFLLELSRKSRETVSLAVPGPGGAVCLDRVDSPDTVITIRTAIGSLFPPHATAVGKATVAHLPKDEIDAILSSSGIPRYTAFTMTRSEDVKEHLREVVQRGYAMDNQEVERGLSGVAAPVLGRDGQVIAAVGMTGRTTRFRGRELARKIAMTKETAAKISASVGNYESSTMRV
jgi:IclR family transcriptional regulator, KDG regulon repressor